LGDRLEPFTAGLGGISHACDNSAFGLDTVVTTGSSWRAEEDVEGNLFAGRSGTAGLRRLRHLMPLSFRDYVIAVRRSLPVPDVIHPTLLQSPQARLAFETMRFAIDDFDLAWLAYLASGGFPRAIHSVE
jgi:uncharacterized protein